MTVSGGRAEAQVASLPPVKLELEESARPFTPAERFMASNMFERRTKAALAPSVPLYPKDSMQQAVIKRSTVWYNSFRGKQTAILQYEPLAQLGVAASQDESAKALFTTKLAMPNLAPHDKGYTLMKAVQSFADEDDPDRMATAEEYQKQLDALPNETSLWKCFGHSLLALAYDKAGKPEQAVTHSNKALELFTSVLSFQDKFRASGLISGVYIAYANIIAQRPGARGQIDALNAKLENAIAVLPPEIAADSEAQAMSQELVRLVRRIIPQAAMLGKKAPAIVAQMWINRPKTDYHTEQIADGTPRLLLFAGGYGSPALPGLERIKKQLEGKAEVMLISQNSGAWGYTFTTPQIESENLRKYFVERQKYTFPIALWVGEKQRTPSGGMLPQRNQNNAAYNAGGGIMYLVDKKGIIRYTTSGLASRDIEARLTKMLEELANEPAPTAAPSSPATK